MNDNDTLHEPQGTLHSAAEGAQEAKAAIQEQLSGAKDAAREAIAGVRQGAAEQTEVARDAAVEGIDSTARGLEIAAEEMEGSPVPQDMLREAAKGLRQISQSIQGKSLGTIVEDLSEFGRRNPAAFLGGAALAGFALARFARASAPEPKPREIPGTTEPGYMTAGGDYGAA